MSGSLEGKVAFITGVARGQGRAHAVKLASEGADIVGVDTSVKLGSVPYDLARDSELFETEQLVKELGRRAVFVSADVRDQQALDDVVARGIAELGKIDVVVANAGIFSQAPFWEMDDVTWQDVIDINLTGVWRTAKAVAPHMIERQSGSIILVSSVNGFRAGYQLAHYVAAKHGVIGLTKNFANELAPYDVRCNAVCPGATDTVMLNNPPQYDRFVGHADGTREEALESVRHFHLLKNRSMLPPSAISEAVAWLASDASWQVTGIALPVDGGHLALDGYNPSPFR